MIVPSSSGTMSARMRIVEEHVRHASEDAIIVEVVIRGHHLGTWRGTARHGSPNRISAVRYFHIRRGEPSSRRKDLL